MKHYSFAGWVACAALSLACASLSTKAQDAPAGLSFPARAPAKRAAWQQRLTLGPGDVLNVSLLDRPETVRTEVSIAPDGRLSFLRTNIVAGGGPLYEFGGGNNTE